MLYNSASADGSIIPLPSTVQGLSTSTNLLPYYMITVMKYIRQDIGVMKIEIGTGILYKLGDLFPVFCCIPCIPVKLLFSVENGDYSY